MEFALEKSEDRVVGPAVTLGRTSPTPYPNCVDRQRASSLGPIASKELDPSGQMKGPKWLEKGE